MRQTKIFPHFVFCFLFYNSASPVPPYVVWVLGEEMWENYLPGKISKLVSYDLIALEMIH